MSKSWLNHLSFVWVCVIFCLWNFLSLGYVSILGIAVIISIIFGSALIGDLFWRLLLKHSPQFDNLIFKLLSGLLLGNCLLFIASLILPFGLVWDWILLLIILTLAGIFKGGLKTKTFTTSNHCEAMVLLVLPLITSWWTHLLLQTPQIIGNEVQFWGSSDVITHMAQLGVQARGHGLSSMSDFIMANAPLHPYHFASYLFPALIAKAEHYSTLVAYSSFLLPAGIFILGLSAYVMGSALFSPAAGVVASLGLLLIPDPFQQGFGNLFLGQSFWLMQSIPAMPYGVAACALVFVFLFEAFRSQTWRLIALAYGFVLVTLLYKAHLFVAISWLALILPPLFMGNYSRGARFIWVAALTLIYLGCMTLSQTLPSMPTLRLDGSGFHEYTHWLAEIQQAGLIKSYITSPIVQTHGRTYLKILTYGAMILACSLGVALFAYPILSIFIARKKPPYITLFPYMVAVIYLTMALGFAMETRGIGEAEELQHRPFIWAYFIFTTWVLAGGYWILKTSVNQIKWINLAVIIAGLGMLTTPWKYSAAVQNLEKDGGLIRIPRCQIEIARFLNEQSNIQDRIQANNSSLVYSAFSGRQNWIAMFYRRLPQQYAEHMQSFERLMQSESPTDIINFMHSNKIHYFIAEPGALTKWNQFFNKQILYQCQDYRIFQFK